MRKQSFEKLLREAVIADAETQGRQLFPELEEVPEEAQARFDAALYGKRRAKHTAEQRHVVEKTTKRNTVIDATDSALGPKPLHPVSRWLLYGLGFVAAAVAVFLFFAPGLPRGTSKEAHPAPLTEKPIFADATNAPQPGSASEPAPEPEPGSVPAPESTSEPEPEPTDAPEPTKQPGEQTPIDSKSLAANLIGTWKLLGMESEDESQSGQIALTNVMLAAGISEVRYEYRADGTGTAFWTIDGESSIQEFTYILIGNMLSFSGETMSVTIDGDRMVHEEQGMTFYYERIADESKPDTELPDIDAEAVLGNWRLKSMTSADEAQSDWVAQVNEQIEEGTYERRYVFRADRTLVEISNIDSVHSEEQYTYSVEGNTMSVDGEERSFHFDGDQMIVEENGTMLYFERVEEEEQSNGRPANLREGRSGSFNPP